MAAERLDALAAVLGAVRAGNGASAVQLARAAGLSRGAVGQHVADLDAAGLIEEDRTGPGAASRASRRSGLRLRVEAGVVAGIDIGATGMVVGLADLSGALLTRVDEPVDIAAGPLTVLGRVEDLVAGLLTGLPASRELWGMAVGVPGSVEVATGLPVAPPTMPGWDRFPIRDRLSRRFAVPVWVDNDVNLLALGELTTDAGRVAGGDLLYVKVGTGIGASLVSGGRIHRGANGSAGDIGHVVVPDAGPVVCRCGNSGCLEAAAGGGALARDARRLAESGASPALAGLLSKSGSLTAADVARAAEGGDLAARTLLVRAGRLIGDTLATLVSFYDPGRVVLGGGVVRSGDVLLAAVREAVYRRSLPLATRSLLIEPSGLGEAAGLIGAVHLVVDALFEADRLRLWLPHSTPAGRPEIAAVQGRGTA